MTTVLPTCTFDSWAVTSLRNSLVSELAADSSGESLVLYFYAITATGWAEIRQSVLSWKKSKEKRSVAVYVGTDHGITDPSAIESMHEAGLDVRLMEFYRGIFHPKVVWLKGKKSNSIWVGSNNLTKDGLLHNIEFAVLIRSRGIPADLKRWAKGVSAGSTQLTPELVKSYREERERFETKRAAAKTTTFTWSKKREPVGTPTPPVRAGDLVLEIMPEETRGGNQIQIPKEAAQHFFGLEGIGDHTTIQLRRRDSLQTRSLVITVFGNNTIRLSINELEYRDRPCVIVFTKTGGGVIEFEIVPESIFPTRYRNLLERCTRQTRAGSRRWAIIGR